MFEARFNLKKLCLEVSLPSFVGDEIFEKYLKFGGPIFEQKTPIKFYEKSKNFLLLWFTRKIDMP